MPQLCPHFCPICFPRQLSSPKWRCAITPEAQQLDYPYCIRIETSTGQSLDVPFAFLTQEQIASFLQTDFKRLLQETGAKGVRVQVHRADCADYENVLQKVAACLQRAGVQAA